MNDILTYSAHMRLQADKILSKSHLLEKLSTFGTVRPIGSYALDLMYDPDIDLVVICDQAKDRSVEALKHLVDSADFSRYEFGDFVQFPQDNRPYGYILVLQLPYEKQLWEIEIWFISLNDYQGNDWKVSLEDINPDQRRTILEIKGERASRGIDKKRLSSFTIYESVLSKGYRSIEDFQI